MKLPKEPFDSGRKKQFRRGAHLIRKMKAAVILLAFGACAIAANDVFSQGLNITFRVSNVSIKQAIAEIEKNSDYVFAWLSNADVETARTVSVDMEDAGIEQILDRLFEGTHLSYRVLNKQVIVYLDYTKEVSVPEMATAIATSPEQTGKRIAGAVTDAKGEALVGVNVVEKGTTNGTATDADGKFLLTVHDNATLQVSYIGFVTQEIKVGSQTNLQIVLTEDNAALEEVVVIGYGVQRKASLTGSLSAIKGEQLTKTPVANLTNALAGTFSGVTVAMNNGGRPGNSSELTIRARGTWNSTTPLYVIDGVVRDYKSFDALNSIDVENITILKDASAASIYGSRAANGVILVTTKRGRSGKTTVSYSGSVGVSDFTLLPERESALQHIAFVNDYEREYNLVPNNNSSVPYSNEWGFSFWPTIYKNGIDASGGYINSSVFTDDEIEWYRTHEYDALQEAWHTPVTQNHSVNVSGGSGKTAWMAGFTYYNESGIFKALNYDKYTVRISLDTEILRNLKWSVSSNSYISIDKSPNGEANIGGSGSDWSSAGNADSDRRMVELFQKFMKSSRMFPVKVGDKYIGWGENFDTDNPVAVADGARGFNLDRYWNTDFTTVLQYDIPFIKGLNAKLFFDKHIRQRYYKSYTTPYEVWQLKREGTNRHIVTEEVLGSITRGKPSLSERHDNEGSYQLNGLLSYANIFGKHDVSAMLGFEQSESSGEWFSASKINYDLLNLPYFNFGPSDPVNFGVNGMAYEEGRLSYFGRFNYGFDNRYLLEFSFRRDASFKFDPKHRWGFFPAGSAAWRISEESFFKNSLADIINNFKLRGSIGLTGNDAVSAFQFMDLLNVNTGGAYYGGDARSYGVAVGKISNPLITWEKSLNYNGGIDIGIFSNMFTFGFDYFFRHTYDILGSQTNEIPDTFGASLSDSNYGVVDSWGYDIELTFNHQINRSIDLWARGNFGFADNKIVEWAETGVPAHMSKIGKNWDRQAGFIADGIVSQMSNNGDGTYTVTTSTGNNYVVPAQGYYTHKGSSYDITANNKYAMRPGIIFYKDLGSPAGEDENGNKLYSSEKDGIITGDDADRTWIIERFNPPYNFGLTLGGKWKGISLEVFFQGLAGHQAIITTPNSAQYGWTHSNWSYWSSDHFSMVNNPDGKMPAPTNMGGLNNTGSNIYIDTDNNSLWVRDASFVRLKNVTLSYDFDNKMLSKLGVSSARIYLTSNNTALLYNPLKYYDPELTSSYNNPDPNATKPGTGMNAYPLMRSFTMGVNFSF